MLELINISKQFDRDQTCVRTALAPMSLSLPPESFTVVTGGDRSGKCQ